VSQDKDLMQLVGPDVSLWDCVTGKYTRTLPISVTVNYFLAPDVVKEKWGVAPELLPHLQCLTGDSSDNSMFMRYHKI
jgi:5'-3' exonuclease